MATEILTAERSEQRMWSDLWQAVPAPARTALGLRQEKFLDADCLITARAPSWLFNRVLGLGLEQEVAESDLDTLIALYHGRNVPICISLCPRVKDRGLETSLQRRGFSIANTWVKMVRPALPPGEIRCDLRIEPARKDQGPVIADILATGFGIDARMKPVFEANVLVAQNHIYIAWDGAKPAAVGILTLYKNIGHLNTAATLPEYRGRGAQGAIMARRIQDGIALGCQGFVSETWFPGPETNHSYNNMLRHGFELAYKRPNWVLPPPANNAN